MLDHQLVEDFPQEEHPTSPLRLHDRHNTAPTMLDHQLGDDFPQEEHPTGQQPAVLPTGQQPPAGDVHPIVQLAAPHAGDMHRAVQQPAVPHVGDMHGHVQQQGLNIYVSDSDLDTDGNAPGERDLYLFHDANIFKVLSDASMSDTSSLFIQDYMNCKMIHKQGHCAQVPVSFTSQQQSTSKTSHFDKISVVIGNSTFKAAELTGKGPGSAKQV